MAERTVKGLVIRDTLGKGAFGYVKLGVQEKTGRCFALKFLLKSDPRFKMKFVECEVDCMKLIKHKNVVRLFDADFECQYPNKSGKFDDTVLMVLEYAPGGDLYDILFYSGKLNEQITKSYFVQLAEGLIACHEAGVVHRDIKANNLLLDQKFRLKITDFGLSSITDKDVKKNRMKTTWVGTRGYQAPEMLLKRPFSHKVDTFAAGVVIFTLLCGHQPFKQASAQDPWYKLIAAGRPDRFWRGHKVKDTISEESKDFIPKLICYQPTERPELRDMLKHTWVSGPNQPPLSDEELYQRMVKLHRNASIKKMADPRRTSRHEASQAATASRFTEKKVWTEQFRSQATPPRPAYVPAFNVFHLKAEVEPIDAIWSMRSYFVAKNATEENVNFDVKEFQLESQMQVATEAGDFPMGVVVKIWELSPEEIGKINDQAPERIKEFEQLQEAGELNANIAYEPPKKYSRFCCHVDRVIAKSCEADDDDIMQAWDEIFVALSKNFTAPYISAATSGDFNYDDVEF